jgi:chromosome segregation ATPase
MMKPGYRHSSFYLRHAPLQQQRGAVGSQPEDTPPSLAELAQQSAQLAAKIQRLQTGLSNLLQLQHMQDSDSTSASDRQTASGELQRLQQAVDEFELELLQSTMGWQQVRETFWLAVRYGGLGLVIGWLLAWLVQRG